LPYSGLADVVVDDDVNDVNDSMLVFVDAVVASPVQVQVFVCRGNNKRIYCEMRMQSSSRISIKYSVASKQ
jgi:hypothetical protein